MLYPLTFKPIFKDRVWGGRKLADLYGRALPPGAPIGESWEISDRPGDVSVIANGRLAGKDLHWLMANHGPEVLGAARPAAHNRFPLLCKILDCADKLSLQVHPPPDKAVELGGEPKTEMWYIADAAPGAELFVGLKRGVTQAQFERQLEEGTVAGCFHRIPVRSGDAIFLPSGRVHAIGAGLVIFEIQQNSDTTYRVFDWNRIGLDGRPRQLHIAESLASINFEDFEPALIWAQFAGDQPVRSRALVRDPLFSVETTQAETDSSWSVTLDRAQIVAVLTGNLEVHAAGNHVTLSAGQFCLLPASLGTVALRAATSATLLRVEAGGYI